MANQEREPRAYELMTVYIPELSEEDNQSQIEKVSGYIANAGGTLTETLTSSPWGRRRLAYTVRFNGVDYRDGFYTVYHFESAPSNLTELERDLKLDTNTMRYLLVHDDPKAGEKISQEEAAEGEGTPDEAAASSDVTGAAAAMESTPPSEGEAVPVVESVAVAPEEAATEEAPVTSATVEPAAETFEERAEATGATAEEAPSEAGSADVTSNDTDEKE